MMNNDNKISKQTKLFGYIGENASTSRFSASINKLFKQNNNNMMMIPMNIREDDLYFTISNMKKSHVNGAVISNEYVDKVVDILDEKTVLVERSGMCDIVFKEGETLKGDIFTTGVLLKKLKSIGAFNVAVIGINPHAKAFCQVASEFKLSFFYENLEELMGFCSEMKIENADINRIADGMSVDFSHYDAVLDFSDLDSLDMVEKLAPYSFDMKNTKEVSKLKNRADKLGANYIGYDDMIDGLAKEAYISLSGV
jgi:hypothetical protein